MVTASTHQNEDIQQKVPLPDEVAKHLIGAAARANNRLVRRPHSLPAPGYSRVKPFDITARRSVLPVQPQTPCARWLK